jgi:glyoxylase-like metal-dependent hydrolase (beta-lactamase superfamily II)
MEPATIIPVQLGIVNAYIVKQDGVILVDTGIPGSENAILSAMEKAGIRKQDIRLIVLTHGHGDHAGSAARLREITGAGIAIHSGDAGMLRTGTQGSLSPTGLVGRIAKAFIGWVNRETYPSADPDVVLNGSFDLAPYGVDGTIIPTPGHTAGSVSVVLSGGDVLAGDLIFPQIPSGKPGLPFWAENPAEVPASVSMLLSFTPRRFLPGHGGPFPADAVRPMAGRHPL